MNTAPKIRLRDWLDTLSAHGRSSFTKIEALDALGVTPVALKLSLLRQTKAGILAKPKSGFYVIVDPPHRALGCLPPEWIIAHLMAYMKLPYYVGGLSAAANHGASHHAVQELQVVVPNVRTGLRSIVCGKVRIRFMRKAAFKSAVSNDFKTPTGNIKVSDPETTAWDLVFFSKSTGGLDNVTTVLKDLAEAMDEKKLKQTIAAHGDHLTARRLGYILQFLGLKELAEACKPAGVQPLRLLEPSAEVSKNIDPVWNLDINHPLDPDQ
jgi:predicted transcriptional regulator of viral defense system